MKLTPEMIQSLRVIKENVKLLELKTNVITKEEYTNHIKKITIELKRIDEFTKV